VLSISIDDEITPALRIMQDNNLRRLPVVKDSRLIGIVSIGDIHRAIFKSCLD
jgi:CBS domain-containing protein